MSEAGARPMTPADRVKSAIGQATASAVSQAKADMRDAINAAMRQATARAEELIRDAVAKATADAQSAAAEAAAAAARVRADFEAKAAEFEEAFDSFDTLADGEALALPAPDPTPAPALEPRQAAELQAELGDLRAHVVELANRIDYGATADGATAIAHDGLPPQNPQGPATIPKGFTKFTRDALLSWHAEAADPEWEASALDGHIARIGRDLVLRPPWAEYREKDGHKYPYLVFGPDHDAFTVASDELEKWTDIRLCENHLGGQGNDITPASRSAIWATWLALRALQIQVDGLANATGGSAPGEVDEPYDGLAAE